MGPSKAGLPNINSPKKKKAVLKKVSKNIKKVAVNGDKRRIPQVPICTTKPSFKQVPNLDLSKKNGDPTASKKLESNKGTQSKNITEVMVIPDEEDSPLSPEPDQAQPLFIEIPTIDQNRRLSEDTSNEVVNLESSDSDMEDSDTDDRMVIAEEEICEVCHRIYEGDHVCNKKPKKILLERDPLSLEGEDKEVKYGRSKKEPFQEMKRHYICPLCHQVLKKSSDLIQHSFLKHGDTSPLEAIKCTKCEFVTSTLATLYVHSNLRHDHKPLYKCRNCIYRAEDITTFQQHIVYNHKKVINKLMRTTLVMKGHQI